MDILHNKLLLVPVTLSLFLTACGGDNSNNNSPKNNSKSQLETNANIAENFVNNLVSPAYKNFANNTKTLPTTINSYCTSIGTSNQSTQLKIAQNTWVALKNQWLATIIYHVGPLADDKGKKLINFVYKKNSFDIDTEKFLNAEIKKLQKNNKYTLLPSTALSARGLDALEMLLFNSKFHNKHSCNYAVAVSKDVTNNAQKIMNTWQNKKSHFLKVKETNGVDLIQPFFDQVAILVDKKIKDAQLDVPLGLKEDKTCTNMCPERVENPISQTSYDSIKASLENLRIVFTGNGGDGFSTFYPQVKLQKEIPVFTGHIDSALSIINSQKTSLYSQINTIKNKNKKSACKLVIQDGKTTDKDLAPCKLYYHVKQLSDDVKNGSFKIAVNLSLPKAVAGDGD